MPFLLPRQSVDVTVPAGQSIIVGNLRGQTVYILNSNKNDPYAPQVQVPLSTTGTVYGPYPNGANLRIVTGEVTTEYVVGTAPVLTALDGGGTSAASGTDPLKFQKWRVALNRMRTGGVNAKFLKIGDSTCIGSGATGAGYVNNGRTKNRVLGLASMMTEQGYAVANGQGTFGTGNNSTTALNLFDTRFVIDTASWASSTATYLNTLGRGTFVSTGLGNLAFTPRDKNAAVVQCDSFGLYYAKNVGLGTANVDINGGGTTVLSAVNAVPAVSVLTMNAALGNNTLNISGAVGAVPILALRAWNSAIPCVEVWQAGAGGAKAADTVSKTSPWSAQNMMELTVQPDLTEISIGINDWIAGTPIAAFTASVQAMITSALVTGDCYLITPPPSAISSTPLATQQLYVDALIALAATNNIICLDLWRRFVSYEIANALGFYRDLLHPRDIGYYDWDSMDMAMLRQL